MPDNQHILYASTHEASSACPAPPISKDGKYLWAIYPEFDIYMADLSGTIVKELTDVRVMMQKQWFLQTVKKLFSLLQNWRFRTLDDGY
ncbi:MAG: hypothetical protein U0T78_06500 [Cloacibacterium normanense]